MGRRVFRCCTLSEKNGGFDFSKPPLVKCNMSVGKGLPSSGFFFSAAEQIASKISFVRLCLNKIENTPYQLWDIDRGHEIVIDTFIPILIFRR